MGPAVDQGRQGRTRSTLAARRSPSPSSTPVSTTPTRTSPRTSPRRQSANCVGGVADTTEGAWRPYTAGRRPRHARGRHDSRGPQRRRRHRCRAGREGLRHQGERPGNGLFYTGERRLRLRVRRRARRRDHQQQLLRRPVALQLQGRPRPEGASSRRSTGPASTPSARARCNVASAGNSNHDLAADAIVDDYQPERHHPGRRAPSTRSECLDVPTQLPGVVTVCATGVKNLKSYYSTTATASSTSPPPAATDRYQIPDTPVEERPHPVHHAERRVRLPAGHLDGLAARRGCRRAAEVDAPVGDPGAAPDAAQGPGGRRRPARRRTTSDGDGTQDAVCEGGKQVNGFYGYGIVNALTRGQVSTADSRPPGASRPRGLPARSVPHRERTGDTAYDSASPALPSRGGHPARDGRGDGAGLSAGRHGVRGRRPGRAGVRRRDDRTGRGRRDAAQLCRQRAPRARSVRPASKKAIAEAGGTIVTSYDRIGVIVVHSSNADFAKTIREVRGRPVGRCHAHRAAARAVDDRRGHPEGR